MSSIPQLVNGNSLEHGITMFVDHGGPSGSQMHVGGQAHAQVAAGTALTNSTVETALSSYTIPANTLVVGSTIRCWAQGIATATNSSDTLTIYLRFGTSTTTASNEAVFTSTTPDAVNNDVYALHAVIQVRTATTAVAMISYQDPDAVATAPKWLLKAEFAINVTAANFLQCSAIWSVASGSNSCRSDMFIVDVVNPST